jgi:putative transposase
MEHPAEGFANLASARQWASDFVHRYNMEHRHNAIQYVTPALHHSGQDIGIGILQARDQVYRDAKQQKPQRWAPHSKLGSRRSRYAQP